MKISEKFSEFINLENNGLDDVVAELNSKVAKGNTKVELMLSEYGGKYFLECMKLANNVIVSFEKEEDGAE